MEVETLFQLRFHVSFKISFIKFKKLVFSTISASSIRVSYEICFLSPNSKYVSDIKNTN